MHLQSKQNISISFIQTLQAVTLECCNVIADSCLRTHDCWGIKPATCWARVDLSAGHVTAVQPNQKHPGQHLTSPVSWKQQCPDRQTLLLNQDTARQWQAWPINFTAGYTPAHLCFSVITPINKGYCNCVTTTKSKATVGLKCALKKTQQKECKSKSTINYKMIFP